MEFAHVTVLLNEAVSALCPERGGVFVDCTAGGGGHSEAILKRLPPASRLISLDRDDRAVERCRLHHGKQLVDSCRGESSHQNNPFVALCDNNADEDKGEVFGFNFVYSGNFYAQAEVTQHKKTRFLMGINPLDFEWLLEKGESFTCPRTKAADKLSDHSRAASKQAYPDICQGR